MLFQSSHWLLYQINHLSFVVLQSSVKSDGNGDTSAAGGVRSLDILSGAAGRQRRHSILPSNVMQAVIGVKFVADHMKQQDDENMVLFFLTFSSTLFRDSFSAVMHMTTITIVIIVICNVRFLCQLRLCFAALLYYCITFLFHVLLSYCIFCIYEPYAA